MRKAFILVALCSAACDRQVDDRTPTAAPASVQPEFAAQSAMSKMSKAPALIPRPKEQAELDRLILAGYTPHADHLHAPGVKECPLTKGSDVVM